MRVKAALGQTQRENDDGGVADQSEKIISFGAPMFLVLVRLVNVCMTSVTPFHGILPQSREERASRWRKGSREKEGGGVR